MKYALGHVMVAFIAFLAFFCVLAKVRDHFKEIFLTEGHPHSGKFRQLFMELDDFAAVLARAAVSLGAFLVAKNDAVLANLVR